MNAVVVGGGLVGPLCALFLAKRGYTVRLYEKRDDPRICNYEGGRTINMVLSNRGRKALKEVGLEEDVLNSGVFMKGRLIHDNSGNHKSILYYRQRGIYSIQRHILNNKLLNALEEHPNVTLYFNHKLMEVENKKGKLIFLHLKNNEYCEVTSDFLVGADGAFSKLRQGIQHYPSFNFSQKFIDHGYVELCISPKLGSGMAPNLMHVWPRGTYLIICFPNTDGSWNATLYMPHTKFQELDSEEKILKFFHKEFPDSVQYFGEDEIVKRLLNKVPASLVSVKCNKFHIGDNLVLIGDAAHAMAPFYGQGMNSAFEDCVILDRILDKCNDNLQNAVRQFSEERVKDAHIVNALSMKHYQEMSDLVTRPTYLMRKDVDDILYRLFPNFWISLNNSVTFTSLSYRDCLKFRQLQNKIVTMINGVFIIGIISIIFKLFL